MKIKTIIGLCVGVVLLAGASTRACSMSPSPYFSRPSYVDPEYRAPNYAYERYGRRWMFELVLRQYVTLESSIMANRDSIAREASRRDELPLFTYYELGAKRFQEADYQGALAIFERLGGTENLSAVFSDNLKREGNYSWVHEASAYMIGRCQLIIAQNDWNGYSSPVKTVNQDMLMLADSSYRRYMSEFPDGLYANSARNLRRRIYFLSGRQALLDSELKQRILEQFPATGTLIMGRSVKRNEIEEFENYFHGEIDFVADSPMLIAFSLLGDDRPTLQDMTALESRERDFANYPGLFQYVRELGLYRLERYQELLDKTPETPLVDTVRWLSTELLRVRAFEKIQNHQLASNVLEQMHKVRPEDAVEVEMACLKLNSGDGLWLYTDRSPIVSERNLSAFATAGLSDGDLETGVERSDISGNRRHILVSELARRYALSWRFKALEKLLEGSEVWPLSSAKTIIATLASNPRDVQALVDMGELLGKYQVNPFGFIGSDNMFHGIYDPSSDLPKCEPCRTFRDRVASYTPPMTLFVSAAEISRRSRIRSDAEAKALHYIVLGGRSGPRSTQFAWKQYADDETIARSKAAFKRLHKLYKDSPWAAKTPYYFK